MSKPSDKPPPPAINLDDLRAALVSLRVAWDDADFVIEDLLRPHRQRFWGWATHAEKHAEAKGSILQAWRFLMKAIGEEVPPDDDSGDDHGDPSGNGGAGPTH